MNQDREMTYVQLNEQVTLQNQDPVLNECAARLGVSLSICFGDIKPNLNTLENLKAMRPMAIRGKQPKGVQPQRLTLVTPQGEVIV